MSIARVAAFGVGLILGTSPSPARPADATLEATKDSCSFLCNVGRDFKGFATSRSTATVLVTGAGLSLLATSVDDEVSRSRINSELFPDTGLDHLLEPGEVGGGGLVQVGAAVTTLAVGKLAKHRAVADLGSALLRAQLLNGAVTTTLKLSTRRLRPDDSNRRSFPSGHTSATFATATVLQRSFGWTAGVPAFAFAGLVGASRLSEDKHYLSDVVFGAAVGIAAGLSAGIEGRDSAIEIRPQLVRGGLGLELSISVR